LTDNPYLNAKRAWNFHTAGLMKSLQIWQLVSVGSLLITLAAIGGLITIGSQSKFIPLVFQQDASGNTLSVTRADRVALGVFALNCIILHHSWSESFKAS